MPLAKFRPVTATALILLALVAIPRNHLAGASNSTVTISNFAFNPASEFVSNGTSITWVNNDAVGYTLWFTNQSDNSTIGFSDPISPGGSWTGSFQNGARIKYYDFDRLWITGLVAVSSFPASLFDFDWADWDNNNKVTIVDAAHLAFCFDTTPSSPLWPSCQYFDLYLQNKVTILDAALLAFLFDQTSGSGPFPGQGQPQAVMDPSWKGVCNILTQPDQNYCKTLH